MADYGQWNPYISVRERRRKAAREIEKRKKRGHSLSPVIIEGRAIVQTVWGKAWCDNLERYSDFANRLPRGRTYVRNGSVIDLQIVPGAIEALVCGSEIYKVTVKVTPVTKARWKSICLDCAGAIDSLVELLQGRVSQSVMNRICRQSTGLFPSPKEIQLSCSCPDWAQMCKHVAAVLYGIGARFDQHPELLFRLHKLDEQELIGKIGKALPLGKSTPSKVLRRDDLSGIFGLEMAPDSGGPAGLSGVTAAKLRPAKAPIPKKAAALSLAKAKPPVSRGSAKNRRKSGR
jgi:SWIM zinc finger